LVHSALSAAREVPEIQPAVLVVTLDPCRDTLSRLPHIAASWDFGEDAYLLGGDVTTVEAALDAWEVERSRDERTGDIAHPSLAYVIDREGSIAFVTTGITTQVVEALQLLGPPSSATHSRGAGCPEHQAGHHATHTAQRSGATADGH